MSVPRWQSDPTLHPELDDPLLTQADAAKATAIVAALHALAAATGRGGEAYNEYWGHQFGVEMRRLADDGERWAQRQLLRFLNARATAEVESYITGRLQEDAVAEVEVMFRRPPPATPPSDQDAPEGPPPQGDHP